jgi:hypothetical protein
MGGGIDAVGLGGVFEGIDKVPLFTDKIMGGGILTPGGSISEGAVALVRGVEVPEAMLATGALYEELAAEAPPPGYPLFLSRRLLLASSSSSSENSA